MSAERFNLLAEVFPQKVKELAESKNVSVGELRKLIWSGVYRIDSSSELVENPINKAIYQFGQAVKKNLPTARQAAMNLGAALKNSASKGVVGIAGEDLEVGDFVILGKDGRIHKVKEEDLYLNKKYSLFHKLRLIGLGKKKAFKIHDMCERVGASDNVKDHLAQSIAAGCVHKEEFNVMFTECNGMFNKKKEVEIYEAMLTTNIKPTEIDYFITLLNIEL